MQALGVSKLYVTSDDLPCTKADVSGCYGKVIAQAVEADAPRRSRSPSSPRRGRRRRVCRIELRGRGGDDLRLARVGQPADEAVRAVRSRYDGVRRRGAAGRAEQQHLHLVAGAAEALDGSVRGQLRDRVHELRTVTPRRRWPQVRLRRDAGRGRRRSTAPAQRRTTGPTSAAASSRFATSRLRSARSRSTVQGTSSCRSPTIVFNRFRGGQLEPVKRRAARRLRTLRRTAAAAVLASAALAGVWRLLVAEPDPRHAAHGLRERAARGRVADRRRGGAERRPAGAVGGSRSGREVSRSRSRRSTTRPSRRAAGTRARPRPTPGSRSAGPDHDRLHRRVQLGRERDARSRCSTVPGSRRWKPGEHGRPG